MADAVEDQRKAAPPALDIREGEGTAARASSQPGSRGRRGWGAVSGAWRAYPLLLLAIALAVAIVLAGAIGSVAVSPLHTTKILLNQTRLFHFRATWPAYEEVILLRVRMPRVIGAALVGAGLGLSGTLFQGLLRNPLADPLLLGTSAGAALGATIAFAVPSLFAVEWLGFGMVAGLAFIGALVAVTLVYRLASSHGHTPVVTLLLAGVAVSAVLAAGQTLLITLNSRLALRLGSLYLWSSGGVNVQSWTEIEIIAVLVGCGLCASVWLAPALDAFALGEEMAAHLGVNVERAKLAFVAVASLLVAAAVSISGLVGFVGLVAPHVCRITLGPRHRLLAPAATLTGALFVVVADLLARRLVAPSEIPLGVITALVGGPFFLALLRQSGSRYRW